MKQVSTKFICTLITTILLSFYLPVFTVLPTYAKPVNYSEDELIVKFKEGVLTTQAVDKHKVKIKKVNSKIKTHTVKLPPGKSVQSAMDEMKKDPSVQYVQPNYTYSLTASANDTYISNVWGLAAAKVNDAWEFTTGSSSVIIAIVDTGVKTNHVDLASNIVPGYNTINNSTNVEDDNGHGTHVAGTAAAIMNNGAGIAGVAGGSKIMPIKAMNSSGQGYDSDISEGIVWAADNGAKVINLSLGMYTFSQSIQDAVNYAWNKGVFVVAAAGNDNISSLSYPASCTNAYSVAAVDQNLAKASFSNYGSAIDIAAPGTQIFSTTFNGSYGYMQGTSMAAPFVAGVAALILSANPSLTPSQVESLLSSNSVDLGSPGRDNIYGNGFVNAQAVVGAAAGQPVATPTPKPTLAPTPTLTPTPALTGIISAMSCLPNPFIATGKTYTTIKFTLTKASTATVKLYDKNNSFVCDIANVIAGGPTNVQIKWCGGNNSGFIVPEGLYTYRISAQDLGNGNVSTAGGSIGVLRKDVGIVTISNLATDSNPFSPDGNNEVKITYSLSGAAKVTTQIMQGRTVIRKLEYGVQKYGGDHTLVWDGKNSKGALVEDSNYTISVNAVNVNNAKSLPITASLIVDGKYPVVSAVKSIPLALKATGSSSATIKYSISEPGDVTIKIYDESGNLVKDLLSGVAQTKGSKIVKWNGSDNSGNILPNGNYEIHIYVVDQVGKVSVSGIATQPVFSSQTEVSGIGVSSNPFITDGSNSITLAYTLSSDAKVNTGIYLGTRLVRSFDSNVQKSKGTYNVTWDGKDTRGKILEDDSYTFKVSTINGGAFKSVFESDNIVLDSQIPQIRSASLSPIIFKPTGKSKATIKYTIPEKVDIKVEILDDQGDLVTTLQTGNQTKGIKTVFWDGKNTSGDIVENGKYTWKISGKDVVDNVAVPVTGTFDLFSSPTEITNATLGAESLTVNGTDTTTFTYDISDTATVTVGVYFGTRLINTLTKPQVQTKGSYTVTWDGRNSSKVLVPQGTYTFKVTAVNKGGFKSIPLTKNIAILR